MDDEKTAVRVWICITALGLAVAVSSWPRQDPLEARLSELERRVEILVHVTRGLDPDEPLRRALREAKVAPMEMR